MLLTWSPAQAAADPELRPFNATYSVNRSSGTAEIKLEQLADGNWSYRQNIHVTSFLARLFLPSEMSSRSLFTLQNNRVTPMQFTADDGAGSSSRDQKLDFDWSRGRVSGVFERKPVDLPTQTGLLDSLSVQVALMNELIARAHAATFRAGGQGPHQGTTSTPGEREETLTTDIGEYRTVIYRSSRAGSDKTTVFWCAPELGYMPLKVERRDGKRVEIHVEREEPSISAAALHAEDPQAFGRVTPCCPWYLPPRSLYEVPHTSSDSKNSICATPSLA